MPNPIARSRQQDDDHFGMSPDQLSAAMAAHFMQCTPGKVKLGMYVPTRLEVRTWSVIPLSYILDLWMYESPGEIIPSDDQIREVIYEISRRADKNDESILNLVRFLSSYIHPDFDESCESESLVVDEARALLDSLFEKHRGRS